LALITNVDIENGCIWQQNSTVKHISFKKSPFWSCRNYIRYNTTQQETHHGRAAGKSKKIFRLFFHMAAAQWINYTDRIGLHIMVEKTMPFLGNEPNFSSL
jgi:hypothetical protein